MKSLTNSKPSTLLTVHINVIDTYPDKAKHLLVNSQGPDGVFATIYPMSPISSLNSFKYLTPIGAMHVLTKYANRTIALSPFLMNLLSDAASKHLDDILDCRHFYFDNYEYKVCDAHAKTFEVRGKSFYLKEKEIPKRSQAPCPEHKP